MTNDKFPMTNQA